MQAEYRRDLQSNYLIIKAAETDEEDGYCLRMAEQNDIPGLLSFHSAWKDGMLYLHYDITAKQPLDHVFAKKMMGSADLRLVLTGICEILDSLQKYLLNPAQLVFDPQYMFLSSDRKQLQLCYLPGTGQEKSISLLAEFLLKKLNHEDRYAVEIGYRFYQETLEENFSLKKTLRELLSEEQDRGGEEKARQETEMPGEHSIPERERSVQPEPYSVTHKVRKRSESRMDPVNRFFQVVHPAVLLSGLFLLIILELLFYFGFVNVTEAGGIFFLMVSGEVLINQYWKRSKEKKKIPEESWITEEEMEEYRSLQEEMYQKNLPEEEIEETRCFIQTEQEKKIRLVCISSENGIKKNYPDIETGSGCVQIGKRKGESDVILDSPTVSRMHAQLETDGGRFYIKDLNSRNGTFWNGQKLKPQEARELSAGDTVAFAEIEYLVYFVRNQ